MTQPPTPEFRRDPITSQGVIIAEGRAARPGAFAASRVEPRERPACPFCAGQEVRTPHATLVEPDDGSPWQVRIIPNKYPAVEGPKSVLPTDHAAKDPWGNSLVGVHEVIVESPRHVTGHRELSEQELATVLSVYARRMQQIKSLAQIRYVQIFKNLGFTAGASLEHLHSQLLGLPFLPSQLWAELSGALDFFHREETCFFCDLIERELAAADRIVLQTEHFVALCPNASRFPYEVWILPRAHASHFENITREQTGALAHLARRVFCRLESLSEEPAYNYVIHTAPFDSGPLVHYHWHIEIYPRITQLAGFELGSGCFVNLVSPEHAACRLREEI